MASLCGHEENLPKIVPFGKGRSLGTQKDSVRDRGAGRGDVKTPLLQRLGKYEACFLGNWNGQEEAI